MPVEKTSSCVFKKSRKNIGKGVQKSPIYMKENIYGALIRLCLVSYNPRIRFEGIFLTYYIKMDFPISSGGPFEVHPASVGARILGCDAMQ